MKGKTVGVIIGIAVMVTVMTVLVIAVGIKTSMPHLTPEQLMTYEGELNGGIRVDGFVVENSIKYDINPIKLAFAVRGLDPKVTVNVIANTLKPDSFTDGKGVIIEGIYDKAKNLIIASKLMTKCPSKYEEKGQGG
ncbi:cytochrome c maturation protein CcmE [Candidatus Poribacteria bacterium]|nr:cytochrome c maturation protein CcmE [Candidatus Poribacteria bacterium]